MNPEQKTKIAEIIKLYRLPEEQQAAAEGFILPAATLLRVYLHRCDLPEALNSVCAQLAIAQQVASGLMAEVSNISSESGGTSTVEAGVKSISQGDTTISYETGGEESKTAASVASTSKIAISPSQVLEQNRVFLNQFRRGVVLP